MKRPSVTCSVLSIAPSRLAALLLVVLLASVLIPPRSLGANTLPEGEDWLKWSDETKLAYVSAYLWGHGRGFRDGCEAGERIYSAARSKGLPGEKCIPAYPVYSKTLENYAGMITEFYRTYPNEKGVPIFKLLDGMSDKRNLTLKQMHEYYGSSARKSQ